MEELAFDVNYMTDEPIDQMKDFLPPRIFLKLLVEILERLYDHFH